MDDDSILVLLRDAIVQHLPLSDIQRLLRCQTVNVNQAVRRGLRLLHYAVFENDFECVRLLIDDYSADVNVLDEAGYSPLHLAGKYGFIDIMHVLIDHGSIINFHTETTVHQPCTGINQSYHDVVAEPLSLCLENNHIDCARLLLFSGANVNQRYFLGYEINVLPFENLAALELILKHGANPNALSRSGLTPLIKACREGNVQAVVLLCRYGANANYVTRKFRQRNAILTAIEMKRADIVEQLMLHGGFVNKHPDLPNGPLELAIRKDQLEMMQLLIAFGADTNEIVQGISPLIIACQSSHLRWQFEMIKCLLENDAEPNQSSSPHSQLEQQYLPYRTPLVTYIKHAPDRRLGLRTVRLLIGYGARVSFSRGRDSVLRCLRRFQWNMELIELLCQASYVFHRNYIDECLELDPKIKEEVVRQLRTVRPLKVIVREEIRRVLLRSASHLRVDRAAKHLPVASSLQRYLLFYDV